VVVVEVVKQKFTLYGKTEDDIESQLLEWRKKNPGIEAFKMHPIEEAPPPMNRHRKEEQHVAFSMLIEYEIPRPRPRRR
jgi:hypothetical protein